jgi:hypothetical protein
MTEDRKRAVRKPLCPVADYEYEKLQTLLKQSGSAIRAFTEAERMEVAYIEAKNKAPTSAQMLRRIFEERLEGVRTFRKDYASQAANETRVTARTIERQNRLARN